MCDEPPPYYDGYDDDDDEGGYIDGPLPYEVIRIDVTKVEISLKNKIETIALIDTVFVELTLSQEGEYNITVCKVFPVYHPQSKEQVSSTSYVCSYSRDDWLIRSIKEISEMIFYDFQSIHADIIQDA